MHELVLVSGPDKGRVFRLEEGQTLVIGRGQASDTRINDPSMSRVHCRAMVDNGAVWLVDAGSSTGVIVKGVKADKIQLKPGTSSSLATPSFDISWSPRRKLPRWWAIGSLVALGRNQPWHRCKSWLDNHFTATGWTRSSRQVVRGWCLRHGIPKGIGPLPSRC